MQHKFNHELLSKPVYLVGNAEIVETMLKTPARVVFDEEICSFLNEVSKSLLSNSLAKKYSDVISFAFWLRQASIATLKKRFEKKDDNIYLGRGIAFHIAPSNVPVNFAYSLGVGLLTGNSNIVRVSSKEFQQVELIVEAIQKGLEKYPAIKTYICIVRYEKNREINDLFSGIADTRIVWGGDTTIAEVRKSPLLPRAAEITFANRYSLAVINSDIYLTLENKEKVAIDFYNDTYLMDQNACTSPKLVVWTGEKKEEAKEIFWEELHQILKRKYTLQPIQGVNKLVSSFLCAAQTPGVRIKTQNDNLIVRIMLSELTKEVMDWEDNSGYFFEYECDDILDLKLFCDDKRCQTIGYLGEKKELLPLVKSGVKGIDRIVPIGKTMDFDVIWDGYNLIEQLTRIIQII